MRNFFLSTKKGTFHSCSDELITNELNCKGEYLSEKNGRIQKYDRKWEYTSKFNFDNLPQALLTLFTVATLEGWSKIYHTAIATNHLFYNYRSVVVIYFVTYIVITAFFTVNIFVGFVIVTFQNESEQEYKNCGLNKNQRHCIEFALKARPVKLYKPTNLIQLKIWSFVTLRPFEYTICILVMLNTIVLVVRHYKEPIAFAFTLNILNFIFIVLPKTTGLQ
ncbi:unnamed protein product [Didymodactylos carnosus]|uniref:Ion transport domain-containing protein n=1 Tax=Didymodactylos carnosus TaxID=1234261 RepID=A0A815Q7T7_9BILA|nr:unnamed protein product [Didymodactylos carnosus]CAF4330185.1 unnamed protein product [Didymodactylos carnosus]